MLGFARPLYTSDYLTFSGFFSSVSQHSRMSPVFITRIPRGLGLGSGMLACIIVL